MSGSAVVDAREGPTARYAVCRQAARGTAAAQKKLSAAGLTSDEENQSLVTGMEEDGVDHPDSPAKAAKRRRKLGAPQTTMHVPDSLQDNDSDGADDLQVVAETQATPASAAAQAANGRKSTGTRRGTRRRS